MDVSDVFYFFRLRRREGGVWGDREGGVGLFIENPRRGVSPRIPKEEGVRGPGIWKMAGGGGLNIVCGAEISHQE